MIGSLTGHVASVEADRCLLEVNGVGYVVMASSRTLASLPQAGGDIVRLLVETQVREDAISLFGFTVTEERDWFRLLTTVQGVGARVALSILSTLTPAELAQAIATGDRTALSRASGVGGKLAARLLTELKDRTPAFSGIVIGSAPAAGKPAVGSDAADAISALLNLGYKPAEAQRAVARAIESLGATADLDQLIRAGLRELVK